MRDIPTRLISQLEDALDDAYDAGLVDGSRDEGVEKLRKAGDIMGDVLTRILYVPFLSQVEFLDLDIREALKMWDDANTDFDGF